MKKNKFISKAKSVLLSVVGVMDNDCPTVEEKMRDILMNDLKEAKREYFCAQQFYECVEDEDCVEYAIAQLNASRAKVGWISKQIKKLNEEIKNNE